MGKLIRLLLVAAVTTPLLAATGCVPHRQQEAWGPGEQTYYVQWEDENHRQHRDWNARSDADHKAYWKWRKHHHDNNQDRDHHDHQ